MTPRRRAILTCYLATDNAKACGVSPARVRRIVREARAEFGCSERMLVLYLRPPRKRVRGEAPLSLWRAA